MKKILVLLVLLFFMGCKVSCSNKVSSPLPAPIGETCWWKHRTPTMTPTWTATPTSQTVVPTDTWTDIPTPETGINTPTWTWTDTPTGNTPTWTETFTPTESIIPTLTPTWTATPTV